MVQENFRWLFKVIMIEQANKSNKNISCTDFNHISCNIQKGPMKGRKGVPNRAGRRVKTKRKAHLPLVPTTVQRSLTGDKDTTWHNLQLLLAPTKEVVKQKNPSKS